MAGSRRPQHKVAHPECPAPNWASCDLLEKARFGQCRAVVGDKEPVPCSRWAVTEEGWCWQHHASEKDRVIREEREAEAKLQLLQKIDAFLRMMKDDPSYGWQPPLTPAVVSTVGLKGIEKGEPPALPAPRIRKPPYRLDATA